MTGNDQGNNQGTVLVIEDDADIRDLMETVLALTGFTVHKAGTGQDGIDAVRTHAPDVITLDVGLPDMAGYDVAREIRRITDCPIIMVSGKSDLVDGVTELDIERCDYLTKPFTPGDLRKHVLSAIQLAFS